MRLSLKLQCIRATHADAPSHYLASPIDIVQMPLEHYIGACYVLPCSFGAITAELLQDRIPSGCRQAVDQGRGAVLFHQGWSGISDCSAGADSGHGCLVCGAFGQ